MLCSLRELSQRGWPEQKSLHLSLSRHSSPSPLPLSFIYSSTLSFHLQSGLPQFRPSISLILTFLLFHNLHSSSSHCGKTISEWVYLFVHSILYTILHLYMLPSHTSYPCLGCSLCTIMSLQIPSQITHFYRMHSWQLCGIPCSSFWSIHEHWQQNTIPWASFHLHGYIPPHHNPWKCSCNTFHNLFTISPSISPVTCKRWLSTVLISIIHIMSLKWAACQKYGKITYH